MHNREVLKLLPDRLHRARLLREDYPDAEITVINTMVNTVLQGLMVLEACNMRDAGVGYAEAVERLYEIRPTGRIFFTIGSIDYLAHGGRIGAWPERSALH